MVLPGFYSLNLHGLLLLLKASSSHADQLEARQLKASVLVSGEGADEGGRVDLLRWRLPSHALVTLLRLLPQLLNSCNIQSEPFSSWRTVD